jgi:predicted acylesterase/phospholipase RssA
MPTLTTIPDTGSLGLALSGGGFRSAGFSLGILEALSFSRALPRVTHVAATSGGSILAAHLVWRWDLYCNPETFHVAAREIRSLMQRGLRGRILRGMLSPGVLLRGLTTARSYLRTALAGQLRALFGATLLSDLAPNAAFRDRPTLQLLATLLNNGALCAFGATRIRLGVGQGTEFGSQDIDVATAVAASCAHPGFFAPTVLYDDEGFHADGQGGSYSFLADGGLIANDATAAFRPQWMPDAPDTILVADAGRYSLPPWSGSWGHFGHRQRSFDILLHENAKRQRKLLDELDRPYVLLPIGEAVPSRQRPTLQRQLSQMRTDLDRCSDEECDALMEHGFDVAASKLNAAPVRNAGEARDVPTAPTAPSDSSPDLSSSSRRRLYRFDPADRASWAMFVAILLLCGTLGTLGVYGAYRLGYWLRAVPSDAIVGMVRPIDAQAVPPAQLTASTLSLIVRDTGQPQFVAAREDPSGILGETSHEPSVGRGRRVRYELTNGARTTLLVTYLAGAIIDLEPTQTEMTNIKTLRALGDGRLPNPVSLPLNGTLPLFQSLPDPIDPALRNALKESKNPRLRYRVIALDAWGNAHRFRVDIPIKRLAAPPRRPVTAAAQPKPQPAIPRIYECLPPDRVSAPE